MMSPDFIFLNLTFDCNNRCKYCYASPLSFTKEMMKLEQVKKYLQFAKEMGMKDVGLIGGEPTLHPNLFEIIKKANDLGLDTTLYTNGRMLADKSFVKKLKKSGIFVVQINIHSTNPQTHDNITAIKGSFYETEKGIENCHKEGVKLRLLSVLCENDFINYKQIIDRYFEMVDSFVFFREIPPIDKLHKQKILSNHDTKNLVEKIFKYSKKKGVISSFYVRMPLCWFSKDLSDEMKNDGAFENLCHMMDGNSLILDLNGEIIPCVHFVGYHLFDIKDEGKILSKREFLKRWNSKRISSMRTKLRGFPSRECMDCKHYGAYCRGGCPLIKFELGPHYKEYKKF